MKSAIAIAALALCLGACASNPGGQSASRSGADEEGKVCRYETASRLGGKSRRVCRDAPESGNST